MRDGFAVPPTAIRGRAKNFGQLDFVTKQQVHDENGEDGNEGVRTGRGQGTRERKEGKRRTRREKGRSSRGEEQNRHETERFDRRARPLFVLQLRSCQPRNSVQIIFNKLPLYTGNHTASLSRTISI